MKGNLKTDRTPSKSYGHQLLKLLTTLRMISEFKTSRTISREIGISERSFHHNLARLKDIGFKIEYHSGSRYVVTQIPDWYKSLTKEISHAKEIH